MSLIKDLVLLGKQNFQVDSIKTSEQNFIVPNTILCKLDDFSYYRIIEQKCNYITMVKYINDYYAINYPDDSNNILCEETIDSTKDNSKYIILKFGDTLNKKIEY